MNKIIKFHILSLCLIFGLSSTIEAMKQPKKIPAPTQGKETKQTEAQLARQRLAARWAVFKEKVSSGFTWLMERINQFFSQLQKPTPTVTTETPQTPSQKITAQKYASWQNIPNAIYFFDKKGSYYEFTNFSEYPYENDQRKYQSVEQSYQFTLNGKKWKTVEQYYQAGKFPSSNDRENIRYLVSDRQGISAGHKAFNYAQNNQNSQMGESAWQARSINQMLVAVRAKFKETKVYNKSKMSPLWSVLLATGDKILVENSDRDPFYGRGANWKGTNHLGRILMHVREELKYEEKFKQSIEYDYDPQVSHDHIKR